MDEKIFDELFELLNAGKFGTLKSELSEMNEVDIAEFFSSLEPKQQLLVFRILPKDISAEVFAYLESEDQMNIVNSITDRELSELVDELFLDDTVDFLEEVPASVVTRVLKIADKETRQLINRFLRYPENSAGSIMTIEMVQLHDNLTVAQAIENIRRTGIDKETIYKEEFEMLYNGASVEDVEAAIDKKEQEKKEYQEKAKQQALEEHKTKDIKTRVER